MKWLLEYCHVKTTPTSQLVQNHHVNLNREAILDFFKC